jgi:hypothetical protein
LKKKQIITLFTFFEKEKQKLSLGLTSLFPSGSAQQRGPPARSRPRPYSLASRALGPADRAGPAHGLAGRTRALVSLFLPSLADPTPAALTSSAAHRR